MSWRATSVLVGLLGLGAVAPAECAAPPARHVDAYGDPLPKGAVARLGTIRWRHDGVSAFAFTRTGETLVSVGEKAVQFWDVKTGKVVRSFPAKNKFDAPQLSMPVAGDVIVVGNDVRIVAYETKSGKELWRFEGTQRDRFECAAISSDGKTVAVGTWESEVKLLEAKTGKHLRTFDSGDLAIARLEFSADGGTLLAVEGTRDERALHVWDVKSGKQIRKWKETNCRDAALSPDGKTVACAAETAFARPRPYDVASGKALPMLESPRTRTRSTELLWTRFGPDGTLALGYNHGIELWDVRKAKLIREISAWWACPVAFRLDGRMLALSSGEEFSLIDLETGKRAFDLPGTPKQMEVLAVSGDGNLVAVATRLGETLLWDARTGRQVGRSPPRKDVFPWQLQFLRDGTSLVGVGSHAREDSPGGKGKTSFRGGDRPILWSWDFRRGRELWPEESLGQVGRYWGFDPRGVLFAHRTESNVTVRHLTTGKVWRKIPLGKVERDRVAHVTAVLFAPDGNTLAVKHAEDRMRGVDLWDLKLGRVVGKVETDQDESARWIGFGIHGRRLFAVHDFRARKWRTCDLWGGSVRTMELPSGMWQSVVSPNGLWIARPDEDILQIIEFATGQVVLTWWSDSTRPERCAWMPDSKRLVAATRPPLVLELPLCADAPKAARLSGEKRRAALWADLESKDAAVAFRAIGWLASHPDEAMPLLEKHLRPVAAPDLPPIHKLIAQLDDDDFETRQAAEAELAKVGYPAKRPLEELMGSGKATPEQICRAHRLLASVKVPDAVVQKLREDVVQLRAMQVLEWIDSPRARRHLKALSEGDPDVALTRYARSTLALTQ